MGDNEAFVVIANRIQIDDKETRICPSVRANPLTVHTRLLMLRPYTYAPASALHRITGESTSKDTPPSLRFWPSGYLKEDLHAPLTTIRYISRACNWSGELGLSRPYQGRHVEPDCRVLHSIET
jgi:hypothetical protein